MNIMITGGAAFIGSRLGCTLKSRKLLNWPPRTSTIEGFRKVVEYAKKLGE